MIRHLSSFIFAFLVTVPLIGQQNRITRPVDTRQTRTISGNVRSFTQNRLDQGSVDPDMPLDYVLLIAKPSAAQQTELDTLLVNQQNPSSPLFHKWLTPGEFGNGFGLSSSDHSKVVAWLTSEGFAVKDSGRARNWIAFSATAGTISKALHTSIRRFRVNGATHFANSSEPQVPEALADVVGGFLGLDDFYPTPYVHMVSKDIGSPAFNSGTSHFLAPEDFSTIYNLAPLYQAGMDGTGQRIVVVGQSNVLLSDIRAFRTRFGLPTNDPSMFPYSGVEPGFTGAQLEGNLDLEWAGAIAPRAAITYVYGTNAFTAMVAAISLNIAPIITVSYGTCEVNASMPFYRSIAQQAVAQGITILVSSGDSGGGGCDVQGSAPLAAKGLSVDFPAVMPEVTAVGGTQFDEGTGNYWAATNSATGASALSYIPEKAWNESSTGGLLSTGGGISRLYPRPVWQNGPGVPTGSFRLVPDISLSAAIHDAYLVTYLGGLASVGGTSASSPALAGIVALLNQYVVSKGQQAQPGLGNINPQLYRLAQAAPSVFHDITAGDNIVQCAQGSPDCLTGTFGYAAGAGYDMATGLGSFDANALVTQWSTSTNAVTVRLSASPATGTVNQTTDLTATVTAATGSGTPTGTVSFAVGTVPLGSASLSSGSAVVTVPLYLLGTGTLNVAATYSGDAAFSSGGVTLPVRVTIPSGAAAILVTAPSNVWPAFPDATGAAWQATLSLRDVGGVSSLVTGFTIDDVPQSLAKYFPSTAIPPNSTLSTIVALRGLNPPLTRVFGFTGVDALGNNWSRRVSVSYFPAPTGQNLSLTATPLVVAQNPSADPACQWSVQLNVDDQGGYLNVMTAFTVYAANSGNNMTSILPSLFGTLRVDAYGGQQGELCLSGVTPGKTSYIEVGYSSGPFNDVSVSFTGPPASPTKITASPATINLAANGTTTTAQATLSVDIADRTQSWSASIFPANRGTGWLTLSQSSGAGPGQITLTANRTGYEAGAYRATITIQSPNALPQYINVPVMFVAGGGGASAPSIGAVVNSANYLPGNGSPGTLMSIFGTNLAGSTALASASPLPYSLGGVTVTINSLPVPLLYVSPTQINIQVPYATGAGPVVLGVNNAGQVGGFAFRTTPSSPAVFVDPAGFLLSTASAKAGSVLAMYLTGAGEVAPQLKSAYAPSTGTSLASLPKPLLPLSVTVGGIPAFVEFVGITPGLIGTVQVNFRIPSTIAEGPQPVVVTVGGVASAAAKITVTAP